MENKRCPLCDRVLTNQGFGGHMWAAHGIRVGEHAKLEDVQKRVVKLEDSLPARVAKLEEELSAKVANLREGAGRVEKLEVMVAELRVLHTRDVPKGIEDGKHRASYSP